MGNRGFLRVGTVERMFWYTIHALFIDAKFACGSYGGLGWLNGYGSNNDAALRIGGFPQLLLLSKQRVKQSSSQVIALYAFCPTLFLLCVSYA